MDPKTAVFWPLDPGRTLLSTLVIHVLLRARTRSLALLKTCPKYVVQTGFRNLPIGAHPHNGSIRACDHVETPLATGEIGGPKNRNGACSAIAGVVLWMVPYNSQRRCGWPSPPTFTWPSG